MSEIFKNSNKQKTMNLNLRDYFRDLYESHLPVNEAVHNKDLTSEATMFLMKRKEFTRVDDELKTQIKKDDKTWEGFRRREKDLKEKDVKLKAYVHSYDTFVEENSVKLSLALKKADSERAQIKLQEHEIKELQIKLDALLARKEQLKERVQKFSIYQGFLECTVKMSMKFENIDQLIARFETILSVHEQLLERQTVVENERERIRLGLRQTIHDQSFVSLDCSNKLFQLQTQLDNIRTQASKCEAVMKSIQSTATKETLLLGQIRIAVLNFYNMISKVPVDVENTCAQLEKIKNFIYVRTGSHFIFNRPVKNKMVGHHQIAMDTTHLKI